MAEKKEYKIKVQGQLVPVSEEVYGKLLHEVQPPFPCFVGSKESEIAGG